MPKQNIFSMSCVASVATVLYAYMGLSSIYHLMNPLKRVDLSLFQPSELVNPLWDTENDDFHMKVYLSQSKRFSLNFLEADEYSNEAYDGKEEHNALEMKSNKKLRQTVLLWNDSEVGKNPRSDLSSLSKSFVLTPKQDCLITETNSDSLIHQCSVGNDIKLGLEKAILWFDPDDSFSIGSTSVLITIYNSIQASLTSILSMVGFGSSVKSDLSETAVNQLQRPEIIEVDEDGPIWSSIMRNNTIHAHVLLIRKPKDRKLASLSEGLDVRISELRRLIDSNSVILGTVSLVKHDEALPQKPKRILYRDISYLFQRYILQDTNLHTPPWHLEFSQPKEFLDWQNALSDKENKVGYPYWKPEVAVRLVSEDAKYPVDMASASGMQIVRMKKFTKDHPSGYAYLPPLHVDEMGLTSEKYVPLNKTVAAVPLRISLDTHGMGGAPLTPQRWRLLSHMTKTLQEQKETGLFEESDIDDVKSLIADTNVTLLAITMLASILHLLFEFLTFKSDVEFWKDNTDLTGLSVRALFLDVICQIIILAYLVEMDSSILMTAPSAVGILIAMWKCNRGAGLKLTKIDFSNDEAKANRSWLNRLFSVTGYEIKATRMIHHKSNINVKKTKEEQKKQELAILTDEMDQVATRTLGSILLPFVIFYAFYTLIVDEYSGWYSWLITTSSSAVYALGFALMTPQLFLNYKLKSVAHLPWRVLCYKFLNTFIDDLFAFIIRMPTMARISCFRDDVVFFVYLAQRYMYPVDNSRPVEGGGGATLEDQNKKNK